MKSYIKLIALLIVGANLANSCFAGTVTVNNDSESSINLMRMDNNNGKTKIIATIEAGDSYSYDFEDKINCFFSIDANDDVKYAKALQQPNNSDDNLTFDINNDSCMCSHSSNNFGCF